jgi:hypothetical protein
MTDQPRPTLSPKMDRFQRAKLDIEHLWQQPQFKRFLFTILDHGHIFSGAYGTDGRHLAFAEGRRSLGFDILRTVERHGSTGALAQILAEEAATQMEAPGGRRKYDRLSELDDGSGDRPERVDRPVHLDYSDERRLAAERDLDG